MSGDVLVVGASLAGATAAATLRERGRDGRILLVGDEPELPYERPPLSKELLLRTQSAEQLRVRPAADDDTLRGELRLRGAAAGLDVARRQVLLADGRRVAYGDLVPATGGTLRHVGLAVTLVDTLAGPLLWQLGPLRSDRVRAVPLRTLVAARTTP